MPLPLEVYGPLVVAFATALGILWKDHQRADAADRQRADEWRDFALDLKDKLGEQIAATHDLAEAVKSRNRRDAQVRRSSDR